MTKKPQFTVRNNRVPNSAKKKSSQQQRKPQQKIRSVLENATIQVYDYFYYDM